MYSVIAARHTRLACNVSENKIDRIRIARNSIKKSLKYGNMGPRRNTQIS